MHNKKIKFICEQDGDPEREFKSAVSVFIEKNNLRTRAYLVCIAYESRDSELNVALCFCENTHQEILLNGATRIFKEIFGANEHLDVLFIDQETEISVRQIACPFYTSHENQFGIPDFYLTSHESDDLKSARKCFKRKKLIGSNRDGYMFCDISPSIVGQQYGLNEKDISQVIIVSRHKGYSLFPITAWPAYVHIARPLIKNLENKFELENSDFESMAWGEVYSGPGCLDH